MLTSLSLPHLELASSPRVGSGVSRDDDIGREAQRWRHLDWAGPLYALDERLDIRTLLVKEPRGWLMDDGQRLPVTPLGQSGYRFGFDDCVVYVDPYLSDSVERLEGEDHRRLTPAPAAPGAVTDARVCCITHIHQDHADPDTLLPLARASAHCRFVCPNEVAKALWAWGIDRDRVVIADREPMRLSDTLWVTPVPAAHEDLDVDEEGRCRYLGYVFEWSGRRFYHAGDTSPHEHLLAVLRGLGPIDVAFLPVNERSFFRKRRGIIGNMSVREAFAMAAEIGVRTLVPMHWDMFAPNSVFREEIELVYRHLNPPFALSINPSAV